MDDPGSSISYPCSLRFLVGPGVPYRLPTSTRSPGILPEVLNDARPERAFEQLACLGLPGSRWDGVPVEELSTGKGNLLGDMKDMRNIELLIFIRFAGISKWDGLGEGVVSDGS